MSSYVCIKCGFRLERATLHALSGGLSDNTDPHVEACPNGCRIDGAIVLLVRVVDAPGIPIDAPARIH